ncbi:MAG: hypothetical protein J0M02_13500, partial [Planctomycetes bacterium]|nr:hypothetical protein [Planctomycetota bacterium]
HPWWRVEAQGVAVPVQAAAVLRGAPAGLARLLADAPLRLHVAAGLAIDPVVLPRRPGAVAQVAGDGLELDLPGPGVWTVALRDRPECALHIAIERPMRGAGSRLELTFGPGVHEVDRIDLRDGDTLWIDARAVLRPRPPRADESPIQIRDWAGLPVWRPFILAAGARRIAIRGGGVIDMSALPWHARTAICFWRCREVTVDGVTILDAPAWGVMLHRVETAMVRDVRNISPRENSDGIDLCNARNVLVEGCFLRTNDDGVCVKTLDAAPAPPSADITVRRATVWNERARALGITSETRQDIHRVRFEDCDIIRDYSAGGECAALAVLAAARGAMRDIAFRRIRVEHGLHTLALLRVAEDVWGHDAQRGSIAGVRLERIALGDGVPALLRLDGHDPGHRIDDVAVSGMTRAGAAITPTVEANAYAAWGSEP